MEEFNLGGKCYKDQQILVFQCVPIAAAADIRNTQGLLTAIKSLNYLGTWPRIPHSSAFKDLVHVSIPSGQHLLLERVLGSGTLLGDFVVPTDFLHILLNLFHK